MYYKRRYQKILLERRDSTSYQENIPYGRYSVIFPLITDMRFRQRRTGYA